MIDFEKQTVEKIIGTEQSARNSENYKQSITTNDESVKSPIQKIRKLKLNTSLKRESNDTSSFIDNLVIFPQTKPAKATNEGQSASMYYIQPASNFRTSIQDMSLMNTSPTKISFKETYSILQNLKQMKDSKNLEVQRIYSDQVQIAKPDYNTQTFNNIDRSRLIENINEKKISSYSQIQSSSGQANQDKKKTSGMILPSLDFEQIYNRNNFFKGTSIGNDTSKTKNPNNISIHENIQTAQQNYFKHRAGSRVHNETEISQSPTSIMKMSKQNVNVRRKLSPLNNNRNKSSYRNRSPNNRQEFEDKTSKDISEIILLLLNQKRPQDQRQRQKPVNL